MKNTLVKIASISALSLGLMVTAVSAENHDSMLMSDNDMSSHITMLTGSVYNGLRHMGLPTDAIGDLSLNEIAQIHFLLNGEDGMNTDGAIRVILDRHN